MAKLNSHKRWNRRGRLKTCPGNRCPTDAKDRLDLPHRVVELIQGEEIAVHLFCSQPIAALRRVPARPREAR